MIRRRSEARLLSMLLVASASLATVALVSASFASSASAQSDLEHAREVFERGTAYYENQNYALALQAFRESYDLLDGHPRQALILFNVGRCYEELGRIRDARDAYRRYLREAADDAENRQQVEERLRELETRVEMDEGAIEHRDSSDASDSESTEASAESGPSAAESGGGGLMTAGIVVTAIGGAGLASFGIFGGLALGEYGTLESQCGGSCTDAEVSTLSTYNVVADVSLAIGLAGVVAGTVLIILGAGDDGADTQTARLVPWVSPTAAGAAVGGTF
ncbi:MAG: tetratricopeptide repeat protein [Sandaracinaceae bacterium]